MNHEYKNDGMKNAKEPLGKSFVKSQASSVIATATDFCIYFLLYKGFDIFYGLSSGIGAVFGAVVSFFLGRHWAFKKKDGRLTTQALRYAVTSGSSVFLNTFGMIWVTETFHISPDVSKVIVAILIGVLFNFLMFRYFVYK